MLNFFKNLFKSTPKFSDEELAAISHLENETKKLHDLMALQDIPTVGDVYYNKSLTNFNTDDLYGADCTHCNTSLTTEPVPKAPVKPKSKKKSRKKSKKK